MKKEKIYVRNQEQKKKSKDNMRRNWIIENKNGRKIKDRVNVKSKMKGQERKVE